MSEEDFHFLTAIDFSLLFFLFRLLLLLLLIL